MTRLTTSLVALSLTIPTLSACQQPPQAESRGHHTDKLASKRGAVLTPPRTGAAPGAKVEPAPAKAPDPTLAKAADNGWGAQFPWRNFEDGKKEAAASGKPMMMIVHTSWCPKCKALKSDFSSRPEIAELAQRFVLVNVNQDDEKWATEYGPDGQYIPRVLFFDSQGQLDASLDAQMSPKYKYFYVAGESLPNAMRRALDRHGRA